ncbi:MAG: hypothetical protein ACFFCZ_21170 [Promethearchaeota archaeon]
MPIEGLIRLKLVNVIRKGREIREDIDNWSRYARGWTGWKIRRISAAPFGEVMKFVRYYLHEATLEIERLVEKLILERELDDEAFLDAEIYESYIDGLLFRWMELRGALEQRLLGAHSKWLFKSDDAARDCYGDFLRAADRINLYPLTRFDPITYLEKSYYTIPAISRFFPVPIIAMPLAGIVNIWNWLALTHETGHDIYYNFYGVQQEAEQIVADTVKGAESDVLNIWIMWTSEIFADLVGILLSGPGFYSSLQEMLTTLPQNISTAEDRVHPIRSVRNAINAVTLREIGFAEEANTMEKRWNAIFAKYQDTVEHGTLVMKFNQMIEPTEKVVKTLLNHPFKSLKGKSINSFVNYNDKDHERVLELKEKFMNGKIDRTAPSRLILAAARLAYEADSNRPNCDTVTDASFKSFVTIPEDLAIFRKIKPTSEELIREYYEKQFAAVKEKALRLKGLK